MIIIISDFFFIIPCDLNSISRKRILCNRELFALVRFYLPGYVFYPILCFSGNPAHSVAGKVFRISPEELAQADRYEVAAYRRVSVTLASGLQAWVYVDARFAPPATAGDTP